MKTHGGALSGAGIFSGVVALNVAMGHQAKIIRKGGHEPEWRCMPGGGYYIVPGERIKKPGDNELEAGPAPMK